MYCVRRALGQSGPTSRMLATLSADPARIALREMLRAVGTEKDLAGVDALLVSTTTQTVVVKAGGEVIRDELDTFVSGLITLKAAGLFPIVVHGGGPQMNQVMDEQGIEPQYAAGLRVTDASVLRVARQVFLDANLKLVERLEQVRAPPLPTHPPHLHLP
jgi:N-acetyl-gamma-glutamyl-phosphate reductase/acetylglutamate kinase